MMHNEAPRGMPVIAAMPYDHGLGIIAVPHVPLSPLHVIVLAAGQGKRMHSQLPKVLHRKT